MPRSRMWAAFAAGDDLVRKKTGRDVAKVTEQGLDAPETRRRRQESQLQAITKHFLAVDDGGAEADVGPWRIVPASKAMRQFPDHLVEHRICVADALGEQHPIKVRRLGDYLEEIDAPLNRHLVVEHVGQGRTEYALPTPVLSEELIMLGIPLHRLAPVCGAGANTWLLGAPGHLMQALIHHGLGVAVVTARADSGTAEPWIESVVAPLNVG